MEVTRLFDPIRYQNEKYPQKISFAHMVDGKWVEYSTQKMEEFALKAKEALFTFPPGEGREGLHALIDFTINRKS